jgi:predicted Rossmann fold nucleotide-binding protein DprA/Smf involved in DNA uptake
MIMVHDSGINKYLNTNDFGLIFSEYPESTRAKPENISWANRLLAGISNALFVPELLKKEPALITVGYAAYLNKPIGVLSQQASSKDATTQLVKDGAIVVTTASELIKLTQLPNTTNESSGLPDHNSVEA